MISINTEKNQIILKNGKNSKVIDVEKITINVEVKLDKLEGINDNEYPPELELTIPVGEVDSGYKIIIDKLGNEFMLNYRTDLYVPSSQGEEILLRYMPTIKNIVEKSGIVIDFNFENKIGQMVPMLLVKEVKEFNDISVPVKQFNSEANSIIDQIIEFVNKKEQKCS